MPYNRGLLSTAVLAFASLAYVAYYHYYLPSHAIKVNIDPSFRHRQLETMILQTWRDYKLHGWGNDIYHPMTPETSHNMPRTNEPLGWIIIDSIDTLMILNAFSNSTEVKQVTERELKQIETWCKQSLDYDMDAEINIFETTIRMLGGLLSAYHISSTGTFPSVDSEVFLDKAIDLADRLAFSFKETQTGIPYSSINLKTGQSIKNHADNGASSTAEFTTLQLEFKYLASITGNHSYWEFVEAVYEPMYKTNDIINRYDGLIPIYTFADNARFFGQNIRFGSRGDSFYEYLLKQYLLTHEPLYYELYRHAIEGMKRHLVKESEPNGYTFIAERPNGLHEFASSKMDHLVCFMGGLLALGATEGYTINEARSQRWWSAQREEDWVLAKDLTRTCYQMYHQIPSGLSPEIVVFNERSSVEYPGDESWWKSPSGDFFVKPLDAHNLQRPETVESLMILYHLTHDTIYREWGAEILDNFAKHTCIHCDDPDKIAYTSLDNVITLPTAKKDNLESFWIAETLKYLYLLFQDDIDLKKVVFNTEAHPFPALDPTMLKNLNLTTGWSI